MADYIKNILLLFRERNGDICNNKTPIPLRYLSVLFTNCYANMSPQFSNKTYKYLCVENKYFNGKYECIKCNNFEDFEDKKRYWIKQNCDLKVISEHRDLLPPYEKGHLYDWTRTDIYRGHPRRPT